MNKFFDLISEVMKGKTIYRILLNWQVEERCRHLSGEVLDLASGGIASYYRYMPRNIKLIRTDYLPGDDIDLVVDLDQPLSLSDGQYRNVLFFNATYILKNPLNTFKEINRIMANNSTLYLASPLIANEMPQPHDYNRLTAEGIADHLFIAGFSDVRIYRIGERVTAATYILSPLFIFNSIRLIAYLGAFFLDYLIFELIKIKNPCPIGYFVVAQKKI